MPELALVGQRRLGTCRRQRHFDERKLDGCSNSALSFDTTRPDNATFGNTGGTGGTANIYVDSSVTVGSLTFDGGSSAKYLLTSRNSNDNITINNGVTANASVTLATGKLNKIYLGYFRQTWNVASGTLTVARQMEFGKPRRRVLPRPAADIEVVLSCQLWRRHDNLNGGELLVATGGNLPGGNSPVTVGPGASSK